MFLPIRTDRRLRRTPWINFGLIASNVVIYLITREWDSPGLERLILDPAEPRAIQFLSYQFLHADAMHLLGNMLFLYVFGNGVEDRLGRFGYALFYLVGGALAGEGHALVETSPVIGASGAVAAVSGAYLVLFPRSRVTIVYWFFIVGAFHVSGMVVILFYFAYDIVQLGLSLDNVAYLAHITGYVYGFVIALALLLTRLLPREPYDLLAWIDHRRRRRSFKQMTDGGYQPWDFNPVKTPPPRAQDAVQLTDQDRRLMQLRGTIGQHLTEQRQRDAADLYVQLIEIDPNQVLPRDQQIDVCNQLASDGRHLIAAQAYELFLGAFPRDHHLDQVQLMLGVLYVRYLDRRQRGRELLDAALTRLRDPAQIELAKSTLAQIDA